MKKLLSVFVVFAFMITAQAVLAASADQISHRIAELQKRIDDGQKSGSLTADEGGRLEKRLGRVRTHFERASRDTLSPQEVKNINRQLDTLSKDVYKEKHDPQTTRSEKQIPRRIESLQARIDNGQRSGDLTLEEAKHLQNRLDSIRNHYEKAGRDTLSEQEIKSIDQRLNNLGKEITKQRQDRQRRKR